MVSQEPMTRRPRQLLLLTTYARQDVCLRAHKRGLRSSYVRTALYLLTPLHLDYTRCTSYLHHFGPCVRFQTALYLVLLRCRHPRMLSLPFLAVLVQYETGRQKSSTSVSQYICESALLKSPTLISWNASSSFPGGVDYPACWVSMLLGRHVECGNTPYLSR